MKSQRVRRFKRNPFLPEEGTKRRLGLQARSTILSEQSFATSRGREESSEVGGRSFLRVEVHQKIADFRHEYVGLFLERV